MITGVPGFVTSEGLLYENALVKAERVRDTRSDTLAVVLSASSATAPCLTRAHNTLLALQNVKPQLVGLPDIMHWAIGETGTAVLILGGMKGEPLSAHLLLVGSLPESVVVEIARRQIAVLAALHEMGYSGLRLTAADVWMSLDDDDQRLTFLGWEWIAQSTYDASEDLKAAVGLWIELGSGMPPGPEVSIENGPAGWSRLSLATRELLAGNWRAVGPLSVEQMGRDLTDLARRLDSLPEEALAQGRELLSRDPATALVWLDMARRTSSAPVGAYEAYANAQASLAQQATALIQQGQRNFALGQYATAEESFGQAKSVSNAGPEVVLSTARWQTATIIMQQAALTNLSFQGFPISLLQSHLIEIVNLIEHRETDRAQQVLEEMSQLLPAYAKLPALDSLYAELRVWQLWRDAREAKRLEDVAAKSAAMLTQQPFVPYWSELMAVLGDPIEAWVAFQQPVDDPVTPSPVIEMQPKGNVQMPAEVLPVNKQRTLFAIARFVPLLALLFLVVFAGLSNLLRLMWPDGNPPNVPLTLQTITLTDTLSPTTRPTDTPSPTTKPTDTPSPTTQPTETPSPTTQPTETPSPTAKPTDTPSPKPTRTPTPTRKPFTPTPTPPSAPNLIGPSDRADASGKVTFAWSWVGKLGQNQGFELLIWRGNNGHNGAAPPVRGTNLELDMSGYAEGSYFWSVVLVQLQPYQRIPFTEASPRVINVPGRKPR